jgi:hypothetical protein
VRADATFEVVRFTPGALDVEPVIATALPVGVATMLKHYRGQITGRSVTIFTSAFDQSSGVGTYVAMESFEGSIDGRTGTFNFVHSASTSGSDRAAQFFRIVPSSGTGELAGISGSGGMLIDADDVHRLWIDFEIAATEPGER